MDVLLVKSNVGFLPATDESREWYSKLKMGATIEAKVTQPRNPLFHRKMFALFKLGFDHWAETAPRMEYKGEEVHPDFERFRKDITILAGKWHSTVNLKGEVRIEADSLKYGSMTNEAFEELYSAVIGVLMTRVFTGPQWTEDRLREVVDELAGFAV